MSQDDDFSAPSTGRDARPPRYVPTLTEVVSAPVPAAVPEVPAYLVHEPTPELAEAGPALVWEPESAPEPVPPSAPADDEERLLRVLQRVEVLLDRRLSAAVAQAADNLSREFAQRLKADMEPLIREAVSEAVAEEWNPANHPPV